MPKHYAGAGTSNRKTTKSKVKMPKSSITKVINYSADTPNLLLDFGTTNINTVSKEPSATSVKVKNDGITSANAIFAFSRYTAVGTVSGTEYLQFLLNPEEEVVLPTTKAIISDAYTYNGTVLTGEAAAGALKDDTDNNVTSGELNNTTSTIVFEPSGGHESFRVGDLIRVEDEVMEVTGTYSDNPTSSTVPDNHIVVRRGEAGTTKASHSGTPDIYFSIHNHYHALGKFSYTQTDDLGRFKCSSFFGEGRNDSGQGGIVAGSVAIQFQSAAWSTIPIGDATANTESGLAANQEYRFNITVDGGSEFSDLTFTTDTSNTKFGGSTGVIAKIQDALDVQYYTAGNLFEKKVIVSLVGGDIRIQSGSHLGNSGITLANPDGGTNIFGVGRIPAVTAVFKNDSRMSPDSTYDTITGETAYKNIFLKDDGYGNLIWKNESKVGTINYESGAIDFTIPELPNAQWRYSVLHTSPFSGRLSPDTTGRKSSLVQVLGNTPQQKSEAKLTVTTF